MVAPVWDTPTRPRRRGPALPGVGALSVSLRGELLAQFLDLCFFVVGVLAEEFHCLDLLLKLEDLEEDIPALGFGALFPGHFLKHPYR